MINHILICSKEVKYLKRKNGYQLITIHGNAGDGKNNIGDNDRDNVMVALGQLTTHKLLPQAPADLAAKVPTEACPVE